MSDRAASTADPRAEPPSGHFPPLDGLRGVAILLVLVHHLYATTTDTAASRAIGAVVVAGWVGVTLFFVLSGFLISGILLDSKGRPHYYGNFYARRVLRIFPLYFAFLAVFAALGGGLGRGPIPWEAWCFLGNAPRLFAAGAIAGPLVPLWTLAVEEQVYLVWPALVALLPRPALTRVFLALIPAALAWRVGLLAGHVRPEAAMRLTPSCLDAFACGGLVAILARRPGGLPGLRAMASWVAIGGGLLLAVIAARLGHFHAWDGRETILSVGLTALSATFAALLALSITAAPGATLNRVLASRALRGFGRYSFALYLFHLAIDAAVRPALARWLEPFARERSTPASAALLAATLGLSYLAAMASWRWFEAPILRLKARFPSPGRGVPDVVRQGPPPAPAGRVAPGRPRVATAE